MELEDGELATGVMLSPTRNLSKDGEIVRRWMEMVLGDKSLGNLPAALHSGELLCDLINKLYKALGMKSQISPVRAQGDDVAAWSNVREYLRACEVLGVARQDLFQPDDLLTCRDMEKVYRNILALQTVAVSLSNRRSIDERSSMINAPDWSPMSEHGVFADDEDLDAEDLDLDSPEAVHMLQQSRWQRLLFEYEHQQQRKEERDRVGDSSASDGLGPLAHGIWRTEERIRAILMRDDRDFGEVPEELHGKLWMLASGAQLEMGKNTGQYERLLALESESTEATRQIDVDLHRTVADEDKELWTEEKSRMMRRVLVAYSFYNPGLGYCQGLNYIVARSLQFLDEEKAFYLLVAIIRLVPDDYYTTMLGLAVDQHVFADLVRLQYPEISEHLSELGGSGMELSLACTEWFLTLFASPTFDRNLTEEYMESIRRDHPNFAQYYEGMHPQIKEEYWGSADSYRQWGARNVRRISTDGFSVSSTKENEDSRKKGDTTCTTLVGHRSSPNGSYERKSGLTRDRRSKSFMHPKKIQSNRANSTPNGRSVKDSDEDAQLIGRSPLAWIQRFEEWHKDMKTQKEKKKAEKRLRRNQRSESLFPDLRNGQPDPWVRGAIDSSPVPLCPQPKKSQGIEGFALGHRRRSNEYQGPPTENIPMLEEPSLSRSYSDPFRSPAGITGHRLRKNASEKTCRETEQGPMGLPQHPFKRDIDEVPQKPDLDEVRKLGRSGSGRASRGFSDQSTLSRSTNSYVNAASFTLDPQEEIQDETNSNPSLDEKNAKPEEQGLSPTLAQLKKPLAHELMYSPVHCRSSSMDFAAEEPGSCAPPQIRRIFGKSMHFRKSSFSFFDKLSSDLENSTHGLDSLVDESEFKTESIGRGSMSSVATGRSSTVDEQRPMGGAISISS
ncbi:hypothetical protein JG688_00001264 [Phytophthora aleatoria]|uniref:Rab-GAP TBC domain-containing protein n=1 Tax=Phytophthora aleatoria TaxID=2496075 RepID=A0A8J5J4A5_9STRA|nr:hypothetical protein JG688_00001264 [Phytophthora aleatoria]